MNTIIEMNGTSVDLKSIGSISFKESPMATKRNYRVNLRLTNGSNSVFNPETGCHELVQTSVSLKYPSYSKAARAHSTLIRAWSRYRDWEVRCKLLREVEQELGIAS